MLVSTGSDERKPPQIKVITPAEADKIEKPGEKSYLYKIKHVHTIDNAQKNTPYKDTYRFVMT